MFEIMVSGRKVIDVDTMGKWRVESNKLPGRLQNSSAIVTDTRVYLLGGSIGNRRTDLVYSAPIVNGLIGSWVTESNKLPIPLYQSSAIVTDTRVYLLGGSIGNYSTDLVYSAPIVNGLIGSWVTESNKLPGATSYSTAVVTESRVYLLGGHSTGGATDLVYSAPIVDGIVGSWVIESNKLPSRLFGSSVIQTESRVYLLGGHSTGGATDLVYSAPIVDGIVGSWVIESNKLPGKLFYSTVAKTDTRVYLLGGSTGNVTDLVYSAPIVNGLIGSWVTESNRLPGVSYMSTSITANSRAYLMGGVGPVGATDLVYSAILE